MDLPTVSFGLVGQCDQIHLNAFETLSLTDWARFQQRYFVHNASYTPGGPLFFYTGNEGVVLRCIKEGLSLIFNVLYPPTGPLEAFYYNIGLPFDWAPEFGALVVFGEHRRPVQLGKCILSLGIMVIPCPSATPPFRGRGVSTVVQMGLSEQHHIKARRIWATSPSHRPWQTMPCWCDICRLLLSLAFTLTIERNE